MTSGGHDSVSLKAIVPQLRKVLGWNDLSPQTLYDWDAKGKDLIQQYGRISKVPSRKRVFAEFHRMVEESLPSTVQTLRMVLKRHALEDPHWARYLLEKLEPEVFGNKERMDVNVKSGSAISHEELMAIVARVKAKKEKAAAEAKAAQSGV